MKWQPKKVTFADLLRFWGAALLVGEGWQVIIQGKPESPGLITGAVALVLYKSVRESG